MHIINAYLLMQLLVMCIYYVLQKLNNYETMCN